MEKIRQNGYWETESGQLAIFYLKGPTKISRASTEQGVQSPDKQA